ncbi:MAG: hypothetical protein ACLFWB_13365 [Armatimonadota bacterium]
MIWLWVLLGVLFFVVLLLGYRVLVGLGRRRVEEVQQKLGTETILCMAASANSFGVQSGGYGQIRGNGVLALTEDELYFLMWIPKREITIATASITGVDTPRSHLGKTNLQPLLKVEFTNVDGEDDSVAWLVPDLEEWKRQVRKVSGA